VTYHAYAGVTGFGLHRHPEHQLAWMRSGSLRVEALEASWELNSHQMVWIPGSVPHEITITTPGVFVSAYAAPHVRPPHRKWEHLQGLQVDDLMAALLLRLADRSVSDGLRRSCQDLLYELLDTAQPAHQLLSLPTDPRARTVATAILADPGAAHELGDWARQLGVSGKTIARGFVTGTRMTFRAWRASARLHAAFLLLDSGEPISMIATRVGYSSTSSFISAFRRQFGVTPGRRQASAAP